MKMATGFRDLEYFSETKMATGLGLKQGFAQPFAVKKIFMGPPIGASLSHSRFKKFSWDPRLGLRWAIRGSKNFHGTPDWAFAEPFAVQKIFTGPPKGLLLSHSRFEKFSRDPQRGFRWAIRGSKNFHGTPKGAFAEPFAVHLDLEKFWQKSGLSQILTKMATGSEDLENFQKWKWQQVRGT
jgi:hypothetical protein